MNGGREEVEKEYGHISGWNTSGITDTSALFGLTDDEFDLLEQSSHHWNELFVEDISRWDVSRVTNFRGMFQMATSFNGNLSNFNTGRVKDMSFMFSDAYSFNNNSVSSWDVGNVEKMTGMFQKDSVLSQDAFSTFDADLSKWNTAKCTDMRIMFNGASKFKGKGLDVWDVGNVVDFECTFVNCDSFNADLSAWDVWNVKTMDEMFNGCSIFNSDLSKWNVENCTNFCMMFRDCSSFNSDLSGE